MDSLCQRYAFFELTSCGLGYRRLLDVNHLEVAPASERGQRHEMQVKCFIMHFRYLVGIMDKDKMKIVDYILIVLLVGVFLFFMTWFGLVYFLYYIY